MDQNLLKAKKLASLLRLPKEYQDAAFVALEEILELNSKLEKTVSVMEGYKPEEITPVLTDLVASISAFRDLVQDKNVDFTPISDMLGKILKEVSIHQKFPDDRTDELLAAIKNLSKSFPEIKVEKTEIDLSGVEERLDKLNAKETQEIPVEDGMVPVKLSEEDLKAIGKGAGENVKIYGGGGNGLAIEAAVNKIPGLAIPIHDYISLSQTATEDIWTYKTGGSGGTTVATVTVTFTSSAKTTITSVAKT